MRNTIVNLVHNLAKENPDIYFLTGDLGYSVIENFQKEFPNRCLNVGIAEQNMMGMAAGLALEGKKVFVYSIVPFVTMRCMEQIRTDVALQNLDVTIIGVGGGFAYGTLGPTHHALEDVAMLRAIPRMKIFVPADQVSAAILGRQALSLGGPLYIRLNRGGEPAIYENTPAMEFGKGFVAKQGSEITILVCGALLSAAIAAAKLLDKTGLNTEVVDMATVKPIDTELICNRINSKKLVVSAEEHNIIGGFGSAVAETVADHSTAKTALFRRLGVSDMYSNVFGNQDYMREVNGLSPEGLYKTIKALYDGI